MAVVRNVLLAFNRFFSTFILQQLQSRFEENADESTHSLEYLDVSIVNPTLLIFKNLQTNPVTSLQFFTTVVKALKLLLTVFHYNCQ